MTATPSPVPVDTQEIDARVRTRIFALLPGFLTTIRNITVKTALSAFLAMVALLIFAFALFLLSKGTAGAAKLSSHDAASVFIRLMTVVVPLVIAGIALIAVASRTIRVFYFLHTKALVEQLAEQTPESESDQRLILLVERIRILTPGLYLYFAQKKTVFRYRILKTIEDDFSAELTKRWSIGDTLSSDQVIEVAQAVSGRIDYHKIFYYATGTLIALIGLAGIAFGLGLPGENPWIIALFPVVPVVLLLWCLRGFWNSLPASGDTPWVAPFLFSRLGVLEELSEDN
jgi:hypothetical protein